MAKNILKFTVTGIVAGVIMGWLLSLGSGNRNFAVTDCVSSACAC